MRVPTWICHISYLDVMTFINLNSRFIHFDQMKFDIPKIPTISLQPRHTYIVVGKPGTGKSTLAAQLSRFTGTKLVHPEIALSNHLANVSEETKSQRIEVI